METSSRDIVTGDPVDDLAGLDRILDDGLLGSNADERFVRLFEHMTTDEDGAASTDVLQLIGNRLEQGELTLKEALVQFSAASDIGRWPIFVLRPSGSAEKAEARFMSLGLSIVPSLASAYRILGLIPLRIPPALAFLRALARRPDIRRLERSWISVSLPTQGSFGGDVRRDPQRLVDLSSWPAEISGVREPIRIGIIDSGIDARHSVLQRTLMDQRSFRRSEERVGDSLGHGTATAGIITRLCPASRFLSAKVVGREVEGNLDDVIRAIGWFDRAPPDILVCNVSLSSSMKPVGIIGTLLQSLVDRGVPVVAPAPEGATQLDAASGVIWVGSEDLPATKGIVLRACGSGLRAPRSINADNSRFPKGQPSG